MEEYVFQIRYVVLIDIWDLYSLRTIRNDKSNIPKESSKSDHKREVLKLIMFLS